MASSTISDDVIKEAILDNTLDTKSVIFRMKGGPRDTFINSFACDHNVPVESIKDRYVQCWRDLFGGDEIAQKLTKEIHIAPAGTKMIGVYDPEEDCPEIYRDEAAMDKDIYGVTAARITVYIVKVVPLKRELAPALLHRVKHALRAVAGQHHDFDPPDDFTISTDDKYWRPCCDRDNKIYLKPEIAVDEKSGNVVLQGPLDLDDLWRFYEALEPWVEPSAQIAEAMNMARHVEVRSDLLERDFKGINYTSSSGMSYEKSPLTRSLAQSLAMFYRHDTDVTGFLHQILYLSCRSLAVESYDLSGRFPALKGMDHANPDPQDFERLAKERAYELTVTLIDSLTGIYTGGKNQNGAKGFERRIATKFGFDTAGVFDGIAPIEKPLQLIKRLEQLQKTMGQQLGESLAGNNPKDIPVPDFWTPSVAETFLRRPSCVDSVLYCLRSPRAARQQFGAEITRFPENGNKKSDPDLYNPYSNVLMKAAEGVEMSSVGAFPDTPYVSRFLGCRPRHEMPDKLKQFFEIYSKPWLLSASKTRNSTTTPAP